jgi:outer membrane putative beta-barrel porin/alpha-amylase
MSCIVNRRPARRLVRLAAAACACATVAAAQAEDNLATDRPDFVESSAVVGRGRVQVETSVAGERDVDAAGTRLSARATPTLVRVGVGERTELRLETDAWSRLNVRDAAGAEQRERGFADVSLGVKWHQQDGDEASGRPALAWLAHLDVDSGSAAFRGERVVPSLRLVAEWELPHDFCFGVMPGLYAERDAEGRRFVGGILAAVVGYAWTPRFRTFLEVAGEQIARSRHGGSVVVADVGAAYVLTPSMQIDAAVSHGLNDDAPDRRWTLGFSVRF